MNPLTELRGIVTVLNTPFDDSLEVDLAALCRHVEYALEAEVTGFLVPAMASEVTKLSAAERRDVLRAVLETVGGARPVIAGVYADDRKSRLRLAEEYVALGASALLVSVPFSTTEQLVADVGEVANVGPELVMVQDWSPGGYGIALDAIERLASEVSAFRSIKIEVAASGAKYSEVLDRMRGSLHVAGGWAVTQMIEGLERGVHAFMPTALHEIYVAIYRRFTEGRAESARDLFNRVLPILSFSNQHLDVSINFFKRLLQHQGIYETARVREPSLPFDRFHRSQADYLTRYAASLIDDVRSGRA